MSNTLTLDEPQLVARLRAGEESAFEQLVRSTSGRLLAAARRLLRNEEDARDAVQSAFIRAFQSLSRFREESRLSTWLHRILVNEALMRLRSRARGEEESIDPLLPTFVADGHQTRDTVDWSEAADKALERAETTRDAKLAALKNPAPGTTAVITSKTVNRLGRPAGTARRRLEDARAAAKAVPAKIPLARHNPAMVRLDTETKLITHAIRMAAFNTETIMTRALHGHYARAGDEAAAVIREALTASGDIIPGNAILQVRLDPLSAPRRTRALAALCDQLNAAGTRYPGTDLILRYEVKDHPGTA